MSNELKKVKTPLILLFIFLIIGIWRYQVTDNVFYIYNFTYIGLAIGLGIYLNTVLSKAKKQWGRKTTQLLVGIYLLVYLGIIRKENMQLEGFFFYLMAGIFAAATLHYFVAKIVGPFLFGRGWCGWACWTAMVLDFLPWENKEPRKKHWGILRYIHFFISLLIVLFFWNNYGNIFSNLNTALYWLIVGNIIYYLLAIALAYILKDNRSFCKYICPIPTLMKITSRFSLMKLEVDADQCINCRQCEENCPMDIKLLKYKDEGKRVLSTECIFCQSCKDICPENAIDVTLGIDGQINKEYLYKN